MPIYSYNNKNANLNSFLSIVYYIKIVISKLFFSLLLIFSLSILIYSKNNKILDIRIKDSIMFLTKPYVGIFKCYKFIINEVKYIADYYTKVNYVNDTLRKDNLNLMIKLMDLKILENENEKLKDILNFTSINNITDYSIKKISLISNNSFVNKIKIKIQENEQIQENDLVIDTKGNLIGKIINIDDKNAEILLISDINFRIPAILKNSMLKILLSGNENNNMKINYFLGEKFNIINEEDVYTYNDDGTIKSGIYVGKIEKIKNDYIIKTAVNLSKIDFVIILHNKI